ALFAPGGSRDVEVTVTAHRPATTGTLELEAPAGWSVGPAGQRFDLAAAGDQARLLFTVTAPADPATARLAARAGVGGMRYDSQRVEVRYPHLPRQLLHPPARLKAVCLDLAIRGRSIGYLAGAGDNVADSLVRMGYAVTMLSEADLALERLREFDAIVIGVRAFNTRADLGPGLPALFGYIEGGGVVIAQYNNPRGLRVAEVAPYALQLSGERVTDENASITLLAPDHPALNVPNRITEADFDGWVQERGLYFPNQWDERFTALLACGDRGEAPLSGGLLVARHGRGYYVYTSLAFFRQLPAGVPGAHRLFANLVSLGK
ncbi:MAG: NEW3 domain-containing protein, partial [Burkholderiales bacterium]|nr:NEW3 domain-containing protein [Burkholderiales bacterium]